MSSFTLIPLTVGDDPSKAHCLLDSLRKYGHSECCVLGAGEPWRGGTMAGPGGGQKINLMKRFLNGREFANTDLILFSDGYDTSVCGTPAEFIRKWRWFQADVVFGAESVNWPGQCTQQPQDVPGRFKFLNSGGYIGRAVVLKEMFNSRDIADHEDDQLFCQELYSSGRWSIKLDNKKDIFCCLSDHVNARQEDAVKNVGPGSFSGSGREIYYVPETRNYPLQLHGNGVAKNVWLRLIGQ